MPDCTTTELFGKRMQSILLVFEDDICLMELLPEIALIGRGRRPPNPTSDSDPFPRGSSQNRVAPHGIAVYACLMGAPHEALRTPAQSPSPEKETTRQGGGAGRNRPRPKSEVSLWGSLWRLAGREIGFSLGGGGQARGCHEP